MLIKPFMDIMTIDYTPMSKTWSSIKLFEDVKHEDILMSAVERQPYRDYFQCDLRSEYDSIHLYKKLKTDCNPSLELRKFLDIWIVEELNHSTGFSRLLHIIFNEDEQKLKNELSKRTFDFSQFGNFFDDEFKLCILFAYDEYYTLVSYMQDDFYHLFGPAEFPQWIARIKQDEARHYVNLIKLIRFKYKHRLSETKKILDEVIQLERQVENYRGTFLFDHECVDESVDKKDIETQCIERILTSLSRF